MKPALYIQMLGNFYLRYQGASLTSVNSPRLQALLTYLVLHRHSPQPRSQLAFLLWPDSSEEQSRTNLRNLFYLLRQALPDPDAHLLADGQTLQWRPDSPAELDVVLFEDSISRAGKAELARDKAGFQAALEQAVGCYQGDLLPSCYADWILLERERLRQDYMDALVQLIHLSEARSDFHQAILYAQDLLRYDPLHEATYRCLMRLHILNGDRAGAIRVYQTCATILREELSVEPSPMTHEAYESLLRMDGYSVSLPMASLSTHPVSLIGREQEWMRLQAAWQAKAPHRSHFVLVNGEAGIGKTCLANEFLRWAEVHGIKSGYARCYASEGDLAYAPIIAWLRGLPLPALDDVWLSEVSRLLPEIHCQWPGVLQPKPLNESWQRQRLYEALARAFLADRTPLILVLDDLQWCGDETLEWLHFLLHFDPTASLLILGTLRPESLPDNPPLAEFLSRLRQEKQVTEFELKALNADQSAALASQIAGQAIDPELAAALFRETEGNPLFIVETVRAGMDYPSVENPLRFTINKPVIGVASSGRTMISDWLSGSIPQAMLGVINERLARLSPAARKVTSLAAILDRSFDYAVLSKALDMEEEALVGALDELCQRRVLGEDGPDRYEFRHNKFRQVVFDSLSAARRRVYHRRIAEALKSDLPGKGQEPGGLAMNFPNRQELAAFSAKVAYHFEQAGQPEQALLFYQRLAELSGQPAVNG